MAKIFNFPDNRQRVGSITYLRVLDLNGIDDESMEMSDRFIEAGMRLAETGRLQPSETTNPDKTRLDKINADKTRIVQHLMSFHNIPAMAVSRYARCHIIELVFEWANIEVEPGKHACYIKMDVPFL